MISYAYLTACLDGRDRWVRVLGPTAPPPHVIRAALYLDWLRVRLDSGREIAVMARRVQVA